MIYVTTTYHSRDRHRLTLVAGRPGDTGETDIGAGLKATEWLQETFEEADALAERLRAEGFGAGVDVGRADYIASLIEAAGHHSPEALALEHRFLCHPHRPCRDGCDDTPIPERLQALNRTLPRAHQIPPPTYATRCPGGTLPLRGHVWKLAWRCSGCGRFVEAEESAEETLRRLDAKR